MKTTMERLVGQNFNNTDEVIHIIRNVNFKKFAQVATVVNALCEDVRVVKNKIELWNDSKMQWEVLPKLEKK